MRANTVGNLISIAVNLLVAGLLWNTGATPEIENAKIIPAFIIALQVYLILHSYSNASFIYRIADGFPEDIEALGGKAAWEKTMAQVNKETNAYLRKHGATPYAAIFHTIENASSPLRPLNWISEIVFGMVLVYIGWFWAGLACLVRTAVHFRSSAYLRSRASRIEELANM